jgi:hypothetical protein
MRGDHLPLMASLTMRIGALDLYRRRGDGRRSGEGVKGGECFGA